MSTPLHIGDRVILALSNEKGSITKVNENTYTVNLDFGIEITCTKKEVVPDLMATIPHKIKVNKTGKLLHTATKSKPQQPGTLDLHISDNEAFKITSRGDLPLEQQLRQLQLAIAEAYKSRKSEIVVIHGVGDGKLKKAVLDYLNAHTNVKEVKPPDAWKYGQGALTVKLK